MTAICYGHKICNKFSSMHVVYRIFELLVLYDLKTAYMKIRNT